MSNVDRSEFVRGTLAAAMLCINAAHQALDADITKEDIINFATNLREFANTIEGPSENHKHQHTG